MDVKRFMTVGLVVSLCLSFAACSKRETPQAKSDKPKPDQNTILRVHWAGKATLAADTNAAGLMRIWELPESLKLQAHILNRLASAPWRAHHGWSSNALPETSAVASATLANLLDQVFNNELVFVMGGSTNSSLEFALAVRSSSTNAAAWRTNFAAVARELFGTEPQVLQSGWQMRPAGASNLLSCSETSNAVLLTWASQTSQLSNLTATELSKETLERSNHWLTVQVRLPELMMVVSKDSSWGCGISNLALFVTGDGSNVLTRGEMELQKPLAPLAEDWLVPTNLIHDPIQTFGAVRGLRPWLENLPLWSRLTGGTPPPNQYFWWAQQGAPFLSFSAFPVFDAKIAFSNVASSLPTVVNPYITNMMAGKIVANPVTKRVSWSPFPAMTPLMEPAVIPEGDYLQFALATSDQTNRPAPSGTIAELRGLTNGLFYHREITGARIEAGLYISQLLRLVFKRPQLPFDGPSITWLRKVGPTLEQSKTRVLVSDGDRLRFERESSVGFTMAELQLLADWLESPEFPGRLHSQVVKLPLSSPIGRPPR